MKAAILSNNTVTNIAKIADEQFAETQGWIVSDSARVGDYYDPQTGIFTRPPTDTEDDSSLAPITQDDLRRELSRVHDAYSDGTTPHRGIEIAIDVEARVNARGTLDAVKSGNHPLPFRWFRGDESILVESVEDMQAIHDVIFDALRRGFESKGKVLATIPTITDPASYSVSAAFRAHL